MKIKLNIAVSFEKTTDWAAFHQVFAPKNLWASHYFLSDVNVLLLYQVDAEWAELLPKAYHVCQMTSEEIEEYFPVHFLSLLNKDEKDERRIDP